MKREKSGLGKSINMNINSPEVIFLKRVFLRISTGVSIGVDWVGQLAGGESVHVRRRQKLHATQLQQLPSQLRVSCSESQDF